MKTMPVPAKHAERYALLRRGFLLSALGGLLCTAPLPIHAAELRTENERSISDKVLLPKTSNCTGMIRGSVEGSTATFGRDPQGEAFPHAAAAVSASGIQSVSDEERLRRKTVRQKDRGPVPGHPGEAENGGCPDHRGRHGPTDRDRRRGSCTTLCRSRIDDPDHLPGLSAPGEKDLQHLQCIQTVVADQFETRGQ